MKTTAEIIGWLKLKTRLGRLVHAVCEKESSESWNPNPEWEPTDISLGDIVSDLETLQKRESPDYEAKRLLAMSDEEFNEHLRFTFRVVMARHSSFPAVRALMEMTRLEVMAEVNEAFNIMKER
jgi:hypothetical protein